jgi:hypothetical protein
MYYHRPCASIYYAADRRPHAVPGYEKTNIGRHLDSIVDIPSADTGPMFPVEENSRLLRPSKKRACQRISVTQGNGWAAEAGEGRIIGRQEIVFNVLRGM